MLWSNECVGTGGRVSTNVFLQDVALDTVQADGRRLEVVVDGLPLFRGAQLAIDTTLVSPLRGDGQPHRRCADVDGAALDEARRRKERTYPELCERHSRARLVVLAAEVGSRWSPPTSSSNSPWRRREVVELLAGVLLWVWMVIRLRPLTWWEISAMCL